MRPFKLFLLSTAALLSACSGDKAEWDASGVFETTEVLVSARTGGEIVRFDLEEGQLLKAGEPIGCIDTVALALKRKQLLATLSATDSRRLDSRRQLASLQKQIADQEAEQQRFRQLVADGAATQKQLDDIGYRIGVLQRELAAAEEKISTANISLTEQGRSIEAQVAQIDHQIAQSRIVSPADGTVLGKYAEPGEFAAPGRALFKVGDVANMKLRAYVSAPQLTTLRIGQRVTVFADQGEEERKTYDGTIVWISDKAEFTPKTIQTRDERSNLVYAVKIAVKNDGLIKRGMYGEVKF